jgi:Flp pilus assembly protein TadG
LLQPFGFSPKAATVLQSLAGNRLGFTRGEPISGVDIPGRVAPMNTSTAGSKAASAGRAMLGTAVRRFRGDRSGATAVEFGLVALPFVAFMFAILETALMFFAGQTMDTAVAQAARMIRTGQAQQQGFDLALFKARICDQINVMMDCSGGLKLDVEKYPTFASINLTTPKDSSGNLNVTENYVPGHGGDIVVVRAYYKWPVFVSKLGNDLTTLPDGNHLLVSTVAFRNEPFPW